MSEGKMSQVWCRLNDNEINILKDFISEKLKEEREALIQEIVTLSDKIESENSTEFNEWRAFKGFRNTLRDKYIINPSKE